MGSNPGRTKVEAASSRVTWGGARQLEAPPEGMHFGEVPTLLDSRSVCKEGSRMDLARLLHVSDSQSEIIGPMG